MNVVWRPHPGPQRDFCSRWEFEAFYGGSAGPGKTDCVVALATRYVDHPGYRGILLRRTYPELEEILDRCDTMYPILGGVWHAGKKRWAFPSGAYIYTGHMQHERDKYKYKGRQYQYIGFDELVEFSPTQYLYLFSRARSIYPELQPLVRSGSNPGGPAHQFVKDRFKIGSWESKKTIWDETTGLSRVFIPAKLKDNPTLLLNDPAYVQRLMMLPEIERMRLMEGIWDAFEGQAFPELNAEIHTMERHGITPRDIPPEWPRYRTFDWGYAKPCSVGWWAVDYDGILWRYREWYGTKPGDEKNIGVRMSPTEVARKIKEIERAETDRGIKIRPGPADPDIWNPRWVAMGKKKFGLVGGSPAEDMTAEGVNFLQADNDRILGRQQVHKRLELDEKGKPQVLVSRECENFWRTMPLLREYEKNPEDIESKHVEDHIYSEVRYMCMFRPVKPIDRPKPDIGSFQAERRKLIKARQLAALRGTSLTEAYGRVR